MNHVFFLIKLKKYFIFNKKQNGFYILIVHLSRSSSQRTGSGSLQGIAEYHINRLEIVPSCRAPDQ